MWKLKLYNFTEIENQILLKGQVLPADGNHADGLICHGLEISVSEVSASSLIQ